MIPVTGDRIVFLGDSITEQQLYTNYAEAWLATRHPELKLTFFNAGWGGDTAAGGLLRLERDVLALKPTLVTVCYGMNDGLGRAPDAAITAAYEAALRGTVERLRSAGARTVLLTPGVVDNDRRTTDVDYNRTLRHFADVVLRLGRELDVPAYDLHALMLDVQTKAKAADPAFTMIPDSVHPDPAGHLVMAYGLLSALGAGPVREDVRIDVAARNVVHGDGVVKAKLGSHGARLSLSLDLAHLPFHVEPQARRILPFLPFQRDFNGLRLHLTGLPAAKAWQLRCGEDRITLAGDAIAGGFDLALADGHAPARRAATVHAFTSDKDRMYFMAWRGLALADPAEPMPGAVRLQAATSAKLDRLRDGLLDRAHRRLELALIAVDPDADPVGNQEFIRWWSLRGPFPGAFTTDHLGGEPAFSATPRVDPSWIAADIAPDRMRNCLNDIIGPHDNCVGYALAAIDSPCDQQAELLLGSDDGIAAWLNGSLVHSNLDISRGTSPDSDRAAIALRRGRNHLLLKISQYYAGWGFCARFAGLAKPVTVRRADGPTPALGS